MSDVPFESMGRTYIDFGNFQHSLMIGGGTTEPIVTIRPDGAVEVNPKYETTEAAKAFWDAVREMNPIMQEAHCARGEHEPKTDLPSLIEKHETVGALMSLGSTVVCVCRHCSCLYVSEGEKNART